MGMMSDPDMRRELRRLAVAYGKPAEAEDELVGLWRHVLDGISDRGIVDAVNRYVRSPARFFPRAGVILEIAQEIEASRFGDGGSDRPTDWNQLQEGPCPVCGAVLQMARDPHDGGEVWDLAKGKWRKHIENDPEPPLRFRVLHDGWLHKSRGISAVGDVVWPAQRRA